MKKKLYPNDDRKATGQDLKHTALSVKYGGVMSCSNMTASGTGSLVFVGDCSKSVRPSRSGLQGDLGG